MTGQADFFDIDERLQRLSDLGDQLEAYAATVDFEIFRAPLEAALAYADGLKGGRPSRAPTGRHRWTSPFQPSVTRITSPGFAPLRTSGPARVISPSNVTLMASGPSQVFVSPPTIAS